MSNMSNKTFTILVDDYTKSIKFHELEILPQMVSKKEQKQNKLSKIVENLPKKEKLTRFIYGELQCMESQKKIKELIIQNQNIIKLNKNFYQNLSNLTLLDLSNNNISKISKKIKQFTNIKHLILNNNLISVIPFYLSDLKFLEEIQLENNLVQLIPINIQNFPCLKILNISVNKLEEIPVELGLVKNLEILLFDKNAFTEIPTSLCYLKKLKRIRLEWFDYVHPRIDIDLKEINLIQSFKLILKELLLQSKIYVDFHAFVLKFSQDKLMDESINTFETEKTECYNNSNFDIFHALNNNYLGIIKSFIKENPDIIYLKDQNGKTPLYLALAHGKRDIYEFLLEKINIKKLIKEDNSYGLLFRTIRIKNFPLLVKLHNLGISLNTVDEKGNNVFHILFSVFTNNYDQCAQIGNYLIENNLNNYNNKNKDGWAPIHIAAKHGDFVCLEWIEFINKILIKKNKEIINVNILGKKNWTALHLCVSSYKYSECIKLLNLGSNVFAKNFDGRSPRFITNNFFMEKILYMKENDFYFNKFNKEEKNNENKNDVKITNNNYYSFKLNNKIMNQNYLNYTKELLSNKNDNNFTLMEKYEYITMLALNDNNDEVQSKCKEILSKIDLNKKYNNIIINEIFGIISKYNLTKMIPDLKKFLEINKNVITGNVMLLREINNTINYLEQIKSRKINIITKINVYINSNNNSLNNKRMNRNNLMLKRPGTISEIKGFKREKDEINLCKSLKNKLLNCTTNKRMNNINEINLGKKFSSEMKKIQEKHVQESLNSVDFELDDTIKNS